ncbi:MAG TPA: LUD domain-containing protein [Desulfomonilaceae bacterium]|nr:LUD domain-containing protein [Desulfomonilaceae bacterium]
MTRGKIIDLFIDNTAKAAAEPVRISSSDELNGVLARILAGSDLIFCPFVTEQEKAIKLSPDKLTRDYTAASACVEEVFAAVAETGSLVWTSQGGKPVQAGLVCTHHVAMVSEESIHETLDDFFSSLGDSPPTNITLETGPSRTGDIEMTLTIGVHGPSRLTVIVF